MTTNTPLHLQHVLDACPTASILVQYNGIICHANELARRKFAFSSGGYVLISNYPSLAEGVGPCHSLECDTQWPSWEEIVDSNSYRDDIKSIKGVRLRGKHNELLPVNINVARIGVLSVNADCDELASFGMHLEEYWYCLYIQDWTSDSMVQASSLKDENYHLMATNEAIRKACGQLIVITDQNGQISSLDDTIADFFGYDSNVGLTGQFINSFLRESSGGPLNLNNHLRRSAEGLHRSGNVFQLEIGISIVSHSQIGTEVIIMIHRRVSSSPQQQQHEELTQCYIGNTSIDNALKLDSKEGSDEDQNDPERPSNYYQELRNHHDVILGILDASFDALFVINEDCIVQMVNSKSLEEFGFTREEFIGSNINIIMTGDVAESHDQYVRNYLKTGTKKMMGTQREVTARRKDGSTFPCMLGLAKANGRSDLICGFIRNLTLEKEALELIERERDTILGILDASFHALFVINEDCIIQMVNAKSSEEFGYTSTEFIGRNINIIMTEDVAKSHDQYVESYLKTGIKKMIGTQREVTARRKDGSTFPCMLGLAESKGRSGLLCGYIRDLTIEKEALSVIKEEQKFLTNVLDASFDSLLVINEKGIIQTVNTAATATFGWSQEEFIGRNISIIMPPGHAEKHDSYLQKYLTTGFRNMVGEQREVQSVRKNGTTFPCILGLSEVFRTGSRLFVGFIKDCTLQKALLIAEAERAASDSLLYNILPVHIANRLKQDPGHIADHYDNTTVLFADIVGFTAQTSEMSPHDVVTMLNDLFSRFDYLVGVYDLNKVKTIGDCYMVSSIPSSETEHDGCARVCRFAVDLMKEVQAFNDSRPHHGHIVLRVGIAIGSVVAGVVGTKRFLFDMWGDTVNVAARMEQHGLPGRIQVTHDVVHNAGNDFSFESRGTLQVKGKGLMEVFILKSAKPMRPHRSVRASQSNNQTPPMRSKSTYL